jgi:hypothetical protein
MPFSLFHCIGLLATLILFLHIITALALPPPLIAASPAYCQLSATSAADAEASCYAIARQRCVLVK